MSVVKFSSSNKTVYCVVNRLMFRRFFESRTVHEICLLSKIVIGTWRARRCHGSLLTPTHRIYKSAKNYKNETKQLNNSFPLKTYDANMMLRKQNLLNFLYKSFLLR